MRVKRPEIEAFVLDNVEKHPVDIVTLTASTFNISRQTAHSYVANEVKKGTIVAVGQTRSVRYFLAGGNHIEFAIKLLPGLLEDAIWAKYIKPMTLHYPENIRNLCSYCFTEIFNNAIDHSEGTEAFTIFDKQDNKLCISILDNGVGIFHKIQKALNLDSEREAILHLSKGKFTTDPSNHTGEGIFLSSRMCDKFSIYSDDIYFSFQNQEWLLSGEKKESFGRGTGIYMEIFLNSQKTTKEVMDKYMNQEIGFHKTIVAVALSASPDDPHISRSQAKRLLMGTEKFREIVLDFRGVSSVGPAFVDEVFRVFQNQHPEIKIQYFNASPEVDAMIKRGLAQSASSPG